jgi:MFS family permease
MSKNLRAFGQEMQADRAWRVVVASAVGYGLGLNVLPYYTLGAFVVPLETSFGWSRAQIQGSLGFMVAATLVGGWAIGWFTDRYGARKTAAVSQVGLAFGLAFLGLCPPELWLWYGLWFAMSLVALGTTPITWTRAIAGWFDQGRGAALALALCGSSVSAAFVPILAFLMQGTIGWREAYFLLAGMVLCIALPCTIWLMPKGATRTSKSGVNKLETDEPGVTVREAISGYRFWLLTLCLFLLGFAVSGIIPNLVPMMVGQGFTTAAASSLVGLLGLAVVCGRVVTGIALDHYWAPWVACALLPLPALSCIILAAG